MSDIEIGELYLVKDWFWLLLSIKEPEELRVGVRAEAYQYAKLISEDYKCNVCVVEENTYVVLLEQDEEFFKFLDLNGNIGWICCRDFSEHFELVKE